MRLLLKRDLQGSQKALLSTEYHKKDPILPVAPKLFYLILSKYTRWYRSQQARKYELTEIWIMNDESIDFLFAMVYDSGAFLIWTA